MKKLTLRADEEVIEEARRLASERGTSISAMFSEFVLAQRRGARQRPPIAPITRALRGIACISDDRSDRELIEEAVWEKHGR